MYYFHYAFYFFPLFVCFIVFVACAKYCNYNYNKMFSYFRQRCDVIQWQYFSYCIKYGLTCTRVRLTFHTPGKKHVVKSMFQLKSNCLCWKYYLKRANCCKLLLWSTLNTLTVIFSFSIQSAPDMNLLNQLLFVSFRLLRR